MLSIWPNELPRLNNAFLEARTHWRSSQFQYMMDSYSERTIIPRLKDAFSSFCTKRRQRHTLISLVVPLGDSVFLRLFRACQGHFSVHYPVAITHLEALCRTPSDACFDSLSTPRQQQRLLESPCRTPTEATFKPAKKIKTYRLLILASKIRFAPQLCIENNDTIIVSVNTEPPGETKRNPNNNNNNNKRLTLNRIQFCAS